MSTFEKKDLTFQSITFLKNMIAMIKSVSIAWKKSVHISGKSYTWYINPLTTHGLDHVYCFVYSTNTLCNLKTQNLLEIIMQTKHDCVLNISFIHLNVVLNSIIYHLEIYCFDKSNEWLSSQCVVCTRRSTLLPPSHCVTF